MRAIVLKDYGDVDQFKLVEMQSLASTETDQKEVEIAAVGINFRETIFRKGVRKADHLPLVMGSEFAGWVKTEKGPLKRVVAYPNLYCSSCDYCKAGEENFCRSYRERTGGYAERTLVDEKDLFEVPKHLTMTEAAAIPLNFLTAWNMLITRANAQPGDTVLVTGASGGVGTAAIILAKKLGLTVVAVTSEDNRKLKLCKKLGSDYVITNSRNQTLSEQIKDIFENGINIVIDTVGKAYFEELIKCSAVNGKIVLIGSTTGTDANLVLRDLYLKHLNILGSRLGTVKELGDVLQFIEKHEIRPVIGHVFDLAEVSEAHRTLESRSHIGKVVLTVGENAEKRLAFLSRKHCYQSVALYLGNCW